VISFACQRNVVDCLRQSSTWFADWMTNEENLSKIRPNIRRIVFCAALKVGSKKELDFAFEQLEKQTNLALGRDLIFGLGCSKELWVLSRLLNKQLENKVVDPLLAIRSVGVNPIGNPFAWNFLKNNWDYIFEKYLFI
jgi:hypothetical protein